MQNITKMFILPVVLFVLCLSNKVDSSDGSKIQEKVNLSPRPLYIFGHMANSIQTTLDLLSRGANAIEIDINFVRSTDLTLYHGVPCDCFRDCLEEMRLDDYLIWARAVTTPTSPNYESKFILLYFDLKVNQISDQNRKIQEGIRFANQLKDYFFVQLPVQSTLRLLISISAESDVVFLQSMLQQLSDLNLLEHIQDYIGFDFVPELTTTPAKIESIWASLNVSNIWQGTGITNCLSSLLVNDASKLTTVRDQGDSYYNKVYFWTIDLRSPIRKLLQFGVDGIMTNQPENVISVMGESQFQTKFRIATVQDNPFAKH